jgi:C-terminal processing protease CtpA/Prc
LLDIGDLLYSVNGKLVRDLGIPDVVKLIIGQPNSRVKLEVFRQNDAVGIHPTPVMVAPFDRKTIELERKLGPNDPRDSQTAGLGILFHKVHAH